MGAAWCLLPQVTSKPSLCPPGEAALVQRGQRKQSKGASSSLSPPPKAWKGSGREPGLCVIPPSCSHFTELGSGFSLPQQSLQPPTTAPAAVPGCSRACGSCCSRTCARLCRVAAEMLQQSILHLCLPFAIPAPASASLGLRTPWCGTLPCVHASSPSLLLASVRAVSFPASPCAAAWEWYSPPSSARGRSVDVARR